MTPQYDITDATMDGAQDSINLVGPYRHLCSNTCARSHRRLRPQAAPVRDSLWRDVAEIVAPFAVLAVWGLAFWLWMSILAVQP